jgi:hypothetical protein
MSNVMLHGVLNMPPNLWCDSPIDIAQRHSHYKQASQRIEQLERELAEVRKQRDILETALMIIEGYYVDGENTYEDWKAMGQTAQNALSRITPI